MISSVSMLSKPDICALIPTANRNISGNFRELTKTYSGHRRRTAKHELEARNDTHRSAQSMQFSVPSLNHDRRNFNRARTTSALTCQHTGTMDFETVMSAIKSNSGRYGYKDVRLTFRRTDKSVPRSTLTLSRNAAAGDDDAPPPADLPVRTRPDQWDE
jgi:hypothetical protein